jgi:hypothetical protein
MPKFKIGDKISNGKIQYTVLDIQTNSLGDSCYVFKHPIKDDNFIWISEQIDESFELVPTNSDELVPTDSDSFDWQSFRAEAAKDILCSIIQSGYYGEDRIEHQSELGVKYANALVLKLKETEEK